MAVPRSKMRIFDKGSISEAMKEAAKESEAHANRQRKRPEKEKGLVDKLARKLRELYYGDRTYLPGHKKRKLKKAGVTNEKIKEMAGGMRGGKKGGKR